MQDFADFLIRFTLGFFFVAYRFRWVYDPAAPTPWLNSTRHTNLMKKLCSCGWPMSYALGAFVAIAEILAGLGLMFGFLTGLSAVGIFAILIVATACTAREKINRQNPVDSIDVISCYLWTVEPVYIVMSAYVIFAGPGRWSLDYVLRDILPLWYW